MTQLTNLSKSFGGQVLFNDGNFKMQSQQKIGFVGRNGSGKSTLSWSDILRWQSVDR